MAKSVMPQWFGTKINPQVFAIVNHYCCATFTIEIEKLFYDDSRILHL